MDNPQNINEPTYLNLINPDLLDDLQERIRRILYVDKKYRDKHYSAKKLIADLKTNKRYVSVVLSVRFHMNYTSLVNKLRVDEAMRLLVDNRYSRLKMEDISDMVGFTNRQSFYSAFVKHNGMSPLQYRKSHDME